MTQVMSSTSTYSTVSEIRRRELVLSVHGRTQGNRDGSWINKLLSPDDMRMLQGMIEHPETAIVGAVYE